MKVNYDFKELNVVKENKEEYLNIIKADIDYFVPAKVVNSTTNTIEIEYDTDGLMAYSELEKKPTVFKLHAIKSVIKLIHSVNAIFQINIENPNNLYFTYDGDVKMLVRTFDSGREKEFEYCNLIKGLIGSLLTKDNVVAIVSSNGAMLENDKLLSGVAEIDKLEDMDNAFNMLINQVMEYEDNELIQVKRGYVGKNKHLIRIGSLLIAILAVISIFLVFIYIPNRTSQLNAVSSYEAGVYEDVLTNLQNTKLSAMNSVTKYIEAESTVKLSQLSDSQKENVLYNLSPTVEEGVLDYWVYIGKNDLDSAYEQSIENNDAQQKAYVLLLLIDQTQNDPNLKTEEKDNLVSTYQGELDSVTQSMEAGEE